MPEQPNATKEGGSSLQQLVEQPSRSGIGGRVGIPPLTLAIVIVCAGIWALLNFWRPPDDQRSWGDWLAPSALEIWAGAYWGLITTAFVHVAIMHALFNIWWAKDFGRLLEPRFGTVKFGLFVLASAVVSSGAQLGFSGQTGIGFSGVVYAFFGYTLAARKRDPLFALFLSRDTIMWMLGWLVLCIVLTQTGEWNVGNAAHVAGLVFGFLLGVHRGNGRWFIPARVAAVVMGLLAVMPTFYMPWSSAWRARKVLLELERNAAFTDSDPGGDESR